MKPQASATKGIYRRVSVRMYGDEKFMRLSPLLPSGQALWMYLLTGPHTGPVPGVFVIGHAALAEALGWREEAFAKAFAEVFNEGLVEFDAKTRLWFIPKAIHHNMPPNPNVVLSWRATWPLLPESRLRDRIYEALEDALSSMSGPLGKAFREACGKPLLKPSPKALAKASGNGMAKQEQEAGTGEEKKTTSSSSRPTIPCPYEDIIALYHECLPMLPRVRLATDDRQRALRKRWGWVLSSTKTDGTRRAETAEQALAWFGEFFARAAGNDFLAGRTSKSPGHEGWRCDIDFLLTDRGLKQVIEKTEAAA